MIKLSSKKYQIEEISFEVFWSKLDEITLGQNINPEISYTTIFEGNFDNIFAGKKSGDNFSVYLYRPLTSGFRTEILAKGKVSEIKNGLKISVRFEVPLWSILVFIFISSILLFLSWLSYPEIIVIVITLAVSLIYFFILKSNHKDIKMEIKKQFEKFGKLKDISI